MVTSSFQMLTRAYLRTKLRKKLNRNLTEEDCSQRLKILLQITMKKTRMGWQGFETFCQRKRAILKRNLSLT